MISDYRIISFFIIVLLLLYTIDRQVMIIFVFAITKVQRYKTCAFNIICIHHSFIYIYIYI